MPIEFTFAGEHREARSQFLVLGADGQYYEYDPAREQIFAIEPDERWEMIPGSQEVKAEILPTGSD